MNSAERNSDTSGRLNISNVAPIFGPAKPAAVAARGALVLAVLSTLLLIVPRPAQAQTQILLHDFTGGSDGGDPMGRLTPDGAGNFYGTTDIGGLGYGTVYELSPNGNGGWNETLLHTFTNYLDGGYPFFTSLIFDSQGNLYGTTTGGGPTGHGVAFELSPKGTHWVETVLYSFGRNGSTGCADPWGGVLMDSAGNLYGTCLNSGFPQTEAIFQLSQSNGVWKQKVIYNYASAADNNGAGGLTMDASGNIFAVLSAAYLSPSVVELSPNGNGWKPTVLHTFGKNIFPESVPVLDQAGNLYGTTQAGGAFNQGMVYELSPGQSGKWTEKILFSFKGGKTAGSGPFGGIVLDAAGNLFGTTTFGGSSDAGTVFELTPNGNGSYQQKVLWIFDGADGNGPLGSMVLDSAGNLYGVTSSGGGHGCSPPVGCGISFEVTP